MQYRYLPLAGTCSSKSSLSNLPNEILVQIVECFDGQREIRRFSLVNSRFHSLTRDYLYRFNIKFGGSSCLFWAAVQGKQELVRKLLNMGADVNVKGSRGRFWEIGVPYFLWHSGSQHDTTGTDGVMPLHAAAQKGYRAVVKSLLEFGANPEAKSPGHWTPMYTALASGHEYIGRMISDRIADVHCSFIDPERRYTPLHVACRLGLPSTAQFFLRTGADVDARDFDGKTPFYYVLQRFGRHPIYTFQEVKLSPQKVISLAKILLKFGANTELEGPHIRTSVDSFTSTREPATIREYGAQHEYEEIRKLFGSESAVSPSKLLPPNSSPQLNTEYTSAENSRGQNRMIPATKGPPNLLNRRLAASSKQSNVDGLPYYEASFESFPPLNTSKAPQSGAKTAAATPWKSAKTEHLLAALSMENEPKSSVKFEPPKPAEPFPKLNDSGPANRPIHTSTTLWANLEKSTAKTAMEERSFGASEEIGDHPKPKPKPKRAKGRGKGRWQSLEL